MLMNECISFRDSGVRGCKLKIDNGQLTIDNYNSRFLFPVSPILPFSPSPLLPFSLSPLLPLLSPSRLLHLIPCQGKELHHLSLEIALY